MPSSGKLTPAESSPLHPAAAPRSITRCNSPGTTPTAITGLFETYSIVKRSNAPIRRLRGKPSSRCSAPLSYLQSWGADWGEDGFVYVQEGANVCGITSQATITDPAQVAAVEL